MEDFKDKLFYLMEDLPDKLFYGSIVIMMVLLVLSIPISIQSSRQGTLELQTILKNECGMEYSSGEVYRNGENLSRICGLTK